MAERAPGAGPRPLPPTSGKQRKPMPVLGRSGSQARQSGSSFPHPLAAITGRLGRGEVVSGDATAEAAGGGGHTDAAWRREGSTSTVLRSWTRVPTAQLRARDPFLLWVSATPPDTQCNFTHCQLHHHLRLLPQEGSAPRAILVLLLNQGVEEREEQQRPWRRKPAVPTSDNVLQDTPAQVSARVADDPQV